VNLFDFEGVIKLW